MQYLLKLSFAVLAMRHLFQLEDIFCSYGATFLICRLFVVLAARHFSFRGATFVETIAMKHMHVLWSIVHVSCLTRVMFDEVEGGGSGGQSSPVEARGVGPPSPPHIARGTIL